MPTLAVLDDFREERWPSMDLCAAMLVDALQSSPSAGVRAFRASPPYRRRFTLLGAIGLRERFLSNADRLLNRHWDYPRAAASLASAFDAFHVVDHSYAHLVHALPPDRTGVYCHDLDAFRCLLSPERERRPAWFRRMQQHVLTGLRRAAVVFYGTAAVRAQIEAAGLVPPERLVAAPLGVAPEFGPKHESGVELPQGVRRPYWLHVGSCIPRKRVDLLIHAFAAGHRCNAELTLVQIGGTFTPQHERLLVRLGIHSRALQFRGVATRALAQLYRGADLVLQPSDAEGFGLPVVEALACGAPVLASDIPALREVGGAAAVFVPVGATHDWREIARSIANRSYALPSIEQRLRQAARFTWAAHAQTIASVYEGLVSVTRRVS